jgi:S-adenosylmethionine:tRNA ribosyltransferase-isomerase
MLTQDFDFNLPTELIAQKSVEPRDSSRLMVIDKKNKTIDHRHFYDIVEYFKKGDVLVWNNSKVFKARLFGRLESLEADNNNDGIPDRPLMRQQEVEIFLVRPMENEGVWKVLAKPGKRVKPGMIVRFAPKNSVSGQASDFYCEVMAKEKDGDILVQFPDTADVVRDKANQYGHIPIPPYVKDEPDQIEVYQTVYSKEEGSVAAPTAGFHFTPELIEKLRKKGVEFAEVTLHVGLGTFLPVKTERVADHTMHAEWVEVSQETADMVNTAKQEGRRVIAVGTTSVRTLEGVAQYSLPLQGGVEGGLLNNKIQSKQRPLPTSPDRGGELRAYTGDINIFITPGFEFKIVDAMITNFHLPKSTLLMLVSAFMGSGLVGRSPSEDREFALDCYAKAVEQKYRFYSFGDGMIII